jgi:hypothetical protein
MTSTGSMLDRLEGLYWRRAVGIVATFAVSAVAAPVALAASVSDPAGPVSSVAAAAPRFAGPSSARVGSRVTFSASGMRAGTYTLRLLTVLTPDRALDGIGCVARIGRPTRPVAGRVRVTGVLPTRLACSSGAGPVEGHTTTRAGAYFVTISRDERGMPFGGDPFLKRKLRLTR